MPLRKLWNSIRGKSTPPSNESTTEKIAAPVAGSTSATIRANAPQAKSEPAPVKVAPAVVSREHKKLCKRIESLGAQSILEVSVGDGRRGTSVVSTLTRKGHSTPIHYIAIDQFELGGNSLSLREFHKQLREFPAKVHLVPMDIDAGLDRVVRTYGQVDLILWGASEQPTAEQVSYLARLSKPNTLWMTQVGGDWTEGHVASLTVPSRRAA